MKTVLCACLGALAAAGTAGAGIVNTGFESGDFTGWTYTGNASSSASIFEPARDPLNAGTQPPFDGTWDPAEGLYFAALFSTDSEGSREAVLTQVFAAFAGETLELDYFFDYGDLHPYLDYALARLTGPGVDLELFAHNTAFANELPDDTNVDWTHVSVPIPADGIFTIEFRVGDADGTFESILGIDDVYTIPSPGALWFGLAAFGLRRRR